MRESVKFDFSNYAYTMEELSQCPQCESEKPVMEDLGCTTYSIDRGFAVHPETVVRLCDKHYKEFREWRDREVKNGTMESWFKGGGKQNP